MTVLVGAPVQALENMSITTQRLITAPCARLAGARPDVSFPVSSTFWYGFTRGSISPSGALSEAWRDGAKDMSPEAIHGRERFRSLVQRRETFAARRAGA